MSETTATRMVARVATISGVTTLWLLAAVFLWRIRVPSGLELPRLDPRTYFTPSQLDASLSYERFVRVVWALSVVASIAALALLARRGPRIARGIALGRIGTGIVVGMLTLTTLWFVRLPFGLAERWWAVRHGLTRGGYASYLVAPWAGLVAEALAGLLAIVVILVLTGLFPRRWWLVAAPVLTAVALLFAFATPYLASVGAHGVRSPRLRAVAQALERREGVHGTPVLVQKVSDTTTQANAVTEGVGPSRRVILWDTLLDGRFSPGEVTVVVGHELAHVARRHVWKGIAWFGLLALPVAFVVAEVTRRRGGLRDPALLPLAMLVLALLGIIAAPVENAISRRYEAEADWLALEATHEPRAAKRLFARFATTSLQQPNPPTWDYVLLENHPTIMQRIAMAAAWRAGRASEGSPARSARARRADPPRVGS